MNTYSHYLFPIPLLLITLFPPTTLHPPSHPHYTYTFKNIFIPQILISERKYISEVEFIR